MIALENASAKPVRLIDATIRPEAARTEAMITPERMASVNVWKIRRGVIGESPATHETTIAVSMLSKPKPESELRGLVYSLTEKARDTGVVWYKRVTVVGAIVLLLTVVLNIIFW